MMTNTDQADRGYQQQAHQPIGGEWAKIGHKKLIFQQNSRPQL
jgi:hypothetical protein